MKRKLFVLSLLFLSLLLLTNLSVHAQESAAQISPTLLEFEVSSKNPYQTSEIYIFNPSIRETQKMQIVVKDLIVVDEKGTYSFVDDPDSRYSLSAWAKVSPSSVNLEPQEPQNLTLEVTPPEETEPGGHYGIILTTATPEGLERLTPKGILVRNIGGVGAALLATVPGVISWEGRILEFLPVPFLNLGPVNFVIRFENQGTVHYKPHGEIEIFDFLGGKVGVVEIKPTRVFPQAIRRLEATWKRLLLVGKYKAKATIYYGEEGQEKVDTAEIYFCAFPYKAAAVLLLTIVVVIAVSKLRKKAKATNANQRKQQR